MNGTDVLILVNTGTEVSPVYTAVGSQRGASLSETNDEIDISSKDSRAGRYLAGRYGSTLSLDGLYVPSNVAYLALKTAQRAGDAILVRIEEEGVEVEEASAIITDMSTDFPDQDAATISIDLRIDGEWAAVGS
jgi:predicted secreted protein